MVATLRSWPSGNTSANRLTVTPYGHQGSNLGLQVQEFGRGALGFWGEPAVKVLD